MNPRDFEIVELEKFVRQRAEAEAALGIDPTRILVDTPILDATNGEQVFEGIRTSILADTASRWVLDLRHVRFIDTAAMTALVHLVTDPRLAGRLLLEGAGSGLKRRWPQVFGANEAETEAEAPAGKGRS